jgi:hypothetical protein
MSNYSRDYYSGVLRLESQDLALVKNADIGIIDVRQLLVAVDPHRKAWQSFRDVTRDSSCWQFVGNFNPKFGADRFREPYGSAIPDHGDGEAPICERSSQINCVDNGEEVPLSVIVAQLQTGWAVPFQSRYDVAYERSDLKIDPW